MQRPLTKPQRGECDYRYSTGLVTAMPLLLLVALACTGSTMMVSAEDTSTKPPPTGCGSDGTTNDYLRCIDVMPACLVVPPSYGNSVDEDRSPLSVASGGRVGSTPPASASGTGSSASQRQEKSSNSGNENEGASSPYFNCSSRPHHVGNRTQQKCRFTYLKESQYYPEGLDRIIFVGDSTIMRDYMHLLHSSPEDYKTKVGKLETGELQGKVFLANGRVIEVFFFRLLHLSTSFPVMDEAFQHANNRTLIVLTIGPHDTSWLVFRKPMPFYKKSNVGRWDAAMGYWRKYSSRLVGHIGAKLKDYGANPDDRPFFILREQYWANCGHVKYAKYPLITRCKDLLMPKVIPYYRSYAKAAFGALGIPTIGIDPLFFANRACYLVDAGHVNRWPCKTVELAMIFLAYKTGREAGVLQGHHDQSDETTQAPTQIPGDARSSTIVAAAESSASGSSDSAVEPMAKSDGRGTLSSASSSSGGGGSVALTRKKKKNNPFYHCNYLFDPWDGPLNWVPFWEVIADRPPERYLPAPPSSNAVGGSDEDDEKRSAVPEVQFLRFETGFDQSGSSASTGSHPTASASPGTPPSGSGGNAESSTDTGSPQSADSLQLDPSSPPSPTQTEGVSVATTLDARTHPASSLENLVPNRGTNGDSKSHGAPPVAAARNRHWLPSKQITFDGTHGGGGDAGRQWDKSAGPKGLGEDIEAIVIMMALVLSLALGSAYLYLRRR